MQKEVIHKSSIGSHARADVIPAVGDENARIRAANVPQFRGVESPSAVNSFDTRKTLGRLKLTRTHRRGTASRLIRDSNSRTRALTHTSRASMNIYLGATVEDVRASARAAQDTSGYLISAKIITFNIDAKPSARVIESPAYINM